MKFAEAARRKLFELDLSPSAECPWKGSLWVLLNLKSVMNNTTNVRSSGYPCGRSRKRRGGGDQTCNPQRQHMPYVC